MKYDIYVNGHKLGEPAELEADFPKTNEFFPYVDITLPENEFDLIDKMHIDKEMQLQIGKEKFWGKIGIKDRHNKEITFYRKVLL